MENKDKKGVKTPFADNKSESSYDDDEFYNLEKVASSMDNTGLIPSPPLSSDEQESYTDLNSIPKVRNKVNNGLQQPKKTKNNED